MLRAPNISTTLSSLSANVSQSLVGTSSGDEASVMISLASGDGSLLASSVSATSTAFEICQRSAAVAASVSVEYTALERLMPGDFKSFFFSTDRRFVRCSRVSRSKDTGSVLLIVSIPSSLGVDELDSLSICRALHERIDQDVLPSIRPVFDNLLSVPPSE